MKKFISFILYPFNKFFSFIFIMGIYFYKKFISPFTNSSCRYLPTCSDYSLEAIKKYGPFKGGYLAIKRILLCHPWGGNGFDPVP